MFEQNLNELTQHVNVRANLIKIKELLQEADNKEVLKKEPLYQASLFPFLLENEDPKVRKNAALIMGILCEEEYGDILFKAYCKEETLFVRSAYLKALKNYPYDAYKEYLSERKKYIESGDFDSGDVKHIAEELKVLCGMLDDEIQRKRHTAVNPAVPVRVILAAREEVTELLCKEIDKRAVCKDVRKVFCGVMTVTRDIRALSDIRYYRELLFPVNGMKSYTKAELPKAVAEGNLMSVLDTLHGKNDSPFYFRVTANNPDTGDIASRIQALSGGRLVNSPSDYEIELKLIAAANDRYGVFVKLHTFDDTRFRYRKNYVAASINPVNAAVITALVKDYLKKDATVLDPCCGVGTMLIERNRVVKAGHMYGVDTFGKAVEGGRENAGLAGVNINFVNRNFFDFTSKHLFDEIITNMPDFAGTEADDFYGEFFDSAKKLLKKNGRMILYSDKKNLVRKNLRLDEEWKLLKELVLKDKEEHYIFVIEK